jgi:hypothetical protein
VILMMWLARPKPLVAVGVALILTIAGVAVQGHQQPAPRGPQERVKGTPQEVPPPFGLSAVDVADERAFARQQLAEIDEAWALLIHLCQTRRIEIDGGTAGPWGRRRLEALRRAGAEKAEIVAALEKYNKDLERLEGICHDSFNHHHPSYDEYEIRFLRSEAQIWLKGEKAR